VKIEVTAGTAPEGGGRDRIVALLNRQAEAAGHPFRSEHLLIEAHEDGRYLGGLQARCGVDWVYVELLAVDEDARRRGVGGALLARLEDEARARGMTGVWLDTFTFQAPGFYERQGYTSFGRIDDYPRGQARVFYTKRLTD
jgi:GNAT superfamily N-acetyltransferase